MAKTSHYPLSFSLFILSLILLHLSLLLQALQNPDTQPLLAFKQSSDPSNIKLTTWSHTTDPCSWSGVSCLHNRVTRLVLQDMDLHGDLNSLNSLTQLRVMSLNRNRFSGPLPDLSNLTSLKLLFLSSNNFSGDFPASLTTLFRLYRLDISGNSLSGRIPATLNRLTHLLTLRIENNKFSGDISELNLVNLQDFNVSGNKLGGKIPKCLSNFPKSAFAGNLIFCGDPMDKKCDDNERSGLNEAITSSSVDKPTTVASPSIKSGNKSSSSSRISGLAIIAIIVGDVLVLIVLSLLLYCYFWRNYSTEKGGGNNNNNNNNNNNSSSSKGGRGEVAKGEKLVYGSGNSGLERGKMVFFEGERRFELEDMLRASAEMLGKGGFGSAYKAVLEDGNVVAVKRLKEVGGNVGGGGGGKREFEQQMEVLGKLRHPNLVSLTAYYFAKDEKLLVYEYMPNGNLFWLLHGNRGPGRTPLDWTTRLKIAAGAARGLVFIHSSCKSLKLTHGNIKSTNILLDKSGNARVSDFGLSSFALPSSVTPRSNGYRAPESPIDNARKLTQKSDVYSFGVLLLELLTGKCPSSAADYGGYGGGGGGGGGIVDLPRWVQSVVREEWTAEVFDLELLRYKDIDEEMVGLLQIAMMCTSIAPDKRPTMSCVLKMIEEIRGVEVSPSHDSVSDSPAVSDGPAN